MLRHPIREEDPRLAIIVPVLNEIEGIEPLLSHLETWRQRGAEIIVVDGGSDDKSDSLIEARGVPLIRSARGRATQMNAGARTSQSPFLMFLHADTRLPEHADTQVMTHLARSETSWGRFDVCIDGRSGLLPIVGAMMNLRSRLTGIATGDQALFMTRTLFEQVGGFPEQPLMEDVEICKRLKHITPPVCLRDRVVTSGRRWDQRGGWRTIFLMWQLRWAYWRGVPADQLAARYR
ncbi:MAG TPA: glycosyl transferase [Marinobacter hydrocarbonoclasticus]|jgi:rSAM/selenodomain-associated transferase 2|uniref:TIGR04283 family arsenosugar biosynthesis glycosyltransferase n=1 Tax=Marinobacter TaxID=2742 RepID=UPI000E9EA780|nr:MULTISPECIES: TIGR04283 family arsenosugar biosynthesis glycosyltransferase [unclassified Marinobacter]HAX10126.1 glycosyl transferase [Marinobacter nauticus]HCR45495.1 glycosyl transferase [Marinobacter nauticus]|tara:strand:- start:54 stop:758 length:705 start_codon:yes stop_codon:yes gene_type:complete